MSTWSTAYKHRLPDSAFLFIAPGGHLDASGRTVPRRLRHFPVRNIQGRISVTHLRSVLSSYGSRADIPQHAKARAQAYARDMLAHIGDTLADEAPASGPRVRRLEPRVRHVGPGEPPAMNARLRHVGPGAPPMAKGPKTTIYVAYTRAGRLCCWHHDRAIAVASSARSGGFVKAVQVTPFDWPRHGPNAAEIPAHATPPKRKRAA